MRSNLLKNRRPYDSEILRNELLTLFCGSVVEIRCERLDYFVILQPGAKASCGMVAASASVIRLNFFLE